MSRWRMVTDWRSWLVGARWNYGADCLEVHLGPWRWLVWWDR